MRQIKGFFPCRVSVRFVPPLKTDSKLASPKALKTKVFFETLSP